MHHGSQLRRRYDKILRYAIYRKWDIYLLTYFITQGLGHRMGAGKGAIDHYATPIKAGRVILEIGGNCEYFEVR